jgi:signal transduction protein with GAF and PtsI domain
MALKKKRKKSLKRPASKERAEINRLLAVITEKDKEIETLTEISKSIVSGKYLEDILNIVVSLTAEMMGSKICSIMVLDKNQQELRIIATQSLSEEYRKKGNIPVGQSISGRVVIEKRPITIPDVTMDPEYIYKDIAKKEGLKSMLAVPMMLKGTVLGVINIYTIEEHTFTESEIRILQSVANQAAIGIENEKLTEETILAKDALEARKLIDRAKGILMQRFKMTEDTAYKTIHKKSMDSCKSMKEVAEAIILAMELER